MKSITAFFKNLTLKKGLLLLLTPILTVLISMKTSIIGLGILIIIDLGTGIRKSAYNNNIRISILSKKFLLNIKSYLLRQTWRKSYEYSIGIVIFVVLETFILGVTPVTILDKKFSLSELSVIVPSAIEIWSIYENLEHVSGHNVFKVFNKLIPDRLLQLFTSSKVGSKDNDK